MLSIRLLVERQNQIDGKCKEIYVDSVTDGVIDTEKYINSKLKCLWLLREPTNDDANDIKSDIHRRLNKGNLYSPRYFSPMRYILYSYSNDFLMYNKKYDNKDAEYLNLLNEVAFVNFSKIRGGSKIDRDKWRQNTNLFEDLVISQIAMLEPDIIICAGTIQRLEQTNYLKGCEKIIHGEKYYYFKKNNQLIIGCYHLSQRTITKEKYINNIISIIKKEKNNK
jgi:hypothetical protein